MSELKARRAYFSEDEYERGEHKICAKVSDCGYDRKNDWWSYAFEDEVYLKSEADKAIEELKEERRWRKFSEEKPEKDQWCLVYHEGEIDADHYTDDCNNHCRFVMYGNYVTHWMPLPKEPEAI